MGIINNINKQAKIQQKILQRWKLAHLRNMLQKKQVKEKYNRQDPILSELIILFKFKCIFVSFKVK